MLSLLQRFLTQITGWFDGIYRAVWNSEFNKSFYGLHFFFHNTGFSFAVLHNDAAVCIHSNSKICFYNTDSFWTFVVKPEIHLNIIPAKVSRLVLKIFVSKWLPEYNNFVYSLILLMVTCCTAFLYKARPSQLAVADGEYKTRPEPFLDLLLEQQVVRENPDSLLTSLLLVAIKDGKSSVLTLSAR